MSLAAHLPLYRAAVLNVRSVEHGIKIFRQDLNRRLVRDSETELQLYTKMYVVLFCMWSESLLLRTVYVPYGFSEAEVVRVLDSGSIEAKWDTCLNLAFERAQPSKGTGLKNAVGPKLKRLIKSYVLAPAVLRNKIAHGQWTKALSAAGTSLRVPTTALLDLIDVVEVDRWFFVFRQFAQIVEDGVESPQKAFHRDVWGRLDLIDNEMKRRESWTLTSKRNALSTRRRRPSEP